MRPGIEVRVALAGAAPAGLDVRPVREDDAGSIVELLNPITTAGTWSVMSGTFTAAEQAEFIRGFPGRGVYHAAVDTPTGRVLGIQDVMPRAAGTPALRHVGEISTFVRLDAHRLGVGRALARATLPAARERGFRTVLATVRADNPVAVAYYQSLGFRVVGTLEEHARVRDGYLDEVLMELLIS